MTERRRRDGRSEGRRDGRGEGRSEGRGEQRDSDSQGPERDPGPQEPEREVLTALKTILVKVAGVVKPLGLTPAEATDLVQRMYGAVLEMDGRLANEPDEQRRNAMIEYVRDSVIRREDDDLVVDHPSGD